MKRKTTLRIMLVTLLLLLPPSLMAGSTPTRVLSQQHAAHLLQQFSQPLNDPPCTLSLPYSTGFESDVSNQAPSCWTTLLGEAYAFNFVYYAHNGNQMLALNSASGEARIATPRIPLPLNQVGVTMWYVDLALSLSGLMRVGFTTNLSGTVQWIDTIPTCYDYTYVDLDFSHLSITDTGYLVFAYTNGSGVGSGLVDDMSIFRRSVCTPVSNLRLSGITNSEATLTWSEPSSAVGYHCYIATTNNRANAFDSSFVAVGNASHTFGSLAGNTRYYAWVTADCGSDVSMEATISFVTNPDCGGVRNLQAVSGYRSMALSWDASSDGEPVTAYSVAFRRSTDTTWLTDTIYDRHYFLYDLTPDTRYDYRVVTHCSDSVGMVEGSAYTHSCSLWVADSAATHASLPVSYSINNSYSQQIYLASELGTADTLTASPF